VDLQLRESVIALAVEAGRAVMEVYGREYDTTAKADSSPLTEADLASNSVIVAGLAALDPETPVMTEETKVASHDERKGWTKFWCVDPLDGTKEFIKRNGEFTVNIALIENGEPVFGVVHAPVLGITYAGLKGEGAVQIDSEGVSTPISVTPYVDGVLRIVASRSHAGPETEALVEQKRAEVGEVELVSKGSSLKLCMVATGEAHLYPRLGPTMEWDTAAAHAVVLAAGGTVNAYEGGPLVYNKENLLNPWFVVSA
jgi:3'(2'), 5'-bisphosphate nucleotidase